MRTILLYMIASAGVLIAYQSISFLSRFIKTRSRDSLWYTSFALISSVLAFTYLLWYTATSERVLEYLIPGMALAYIMFALHIKCMGIYFGNESRFINIAVSAILAITFVFAIVMLVGWNTGHHLLATPRAEPLDLQNELLPRHFYNYYTLTPLAKAMHASVRLITLASLVYLLVWGKTKRDRFVQLGVVLTILFILHNVISVSFARGLYLPLLPFMNLIEISRLEWRARRGESLHLSRLEEKVTSFDQGMKEHIKLKQIGQNTGNLVHDAINVAFSSDNYLGAMQKDGRYTGNEPLAEDLQAARANNQRLLDLLTTYRKSHLQDNPDEQMNLKLILEDAHASISHRLAQWDIQYSVEGSSEHIIRGDRIKLTMTMVNLFNNACDAVSDKPDAWIRVVVRDDESSVVISVVNSGKAIAEDIRGNIFKPFFTTKSESGGSGLGLSICRGHVQEMGGDLRLNEDTKHTRFDIVLPAE